LLNFEIFPHKKTGIKFRKCWVKTEKKAGWGMGEWHPFFFPEAAKDIEAMLDMP
jgi:hypothetical protein